MKPSLLAIAFLFFLPLLSNGQSRWINTYHEDIHSYITDLAVDYDGGYLLLAYTLSLDGHRNWLMKTDINGEMLWEKFIDFDNEGLAHFECMAINEKGDVFLAGTNQYDWHNPLITKLNACKEVEWCRRISTTIINDYAYRICALSDGGCTVTLVNNDFVWTENRECLYSIDAEGNYKWMECYDGLDTTILSIDPENLIQTPDKGYLLTGSCDFSDTTPVVYYRRLPYLMKTDSIGRFQWELIVGNDTTLNRGNGMGSILSPDGLYIYTSIRKYLNDEDGYLPALVKTDMEGNEIGIYDLAPPGSNNSALYESVFINDSILASIAGWGDEPVQKKIILIDTEGNILQQEQYLDNEFWFSNIHDKLKIDSEGKLVIFAQLLDEDDYGHVYFRKFNNLLIDDTLYLQPFHYDSLCSYPVLTDTINLDGCGLILNIAEKPSGQFSQPTCLNGWPNPCRDYINLSLDNCGNPNLIELFNMYGQILHSREIGINEKQVNIDTASFPPGIIIAVLRTKDNQFFTMKIIKL
jgi:hypothetical protein